MKKSYIKINNETIPTPDEIDFEFRDIEGSSSGVTEAGITHRLNNRMHYAVRLHVCIVVKVENTTESKLLFIRTKRT